MHSEKKVLIITYYWPPSGGSGVQRWLKFVKYLPQFGWEPVVFTPENPSFAIRDESLLKDVPIEAEVIRFPIWEPYDVFHKIAKFFGAGKSISGAVQVSTGRSFFQSISTWIRGNIFIPDPRRFWVKPSVEFLADFIRENKIKTVITTGPPHSVHLIGLRLKKKLPGIKWIADFRDPWSQWGLLDSLKVGSLARSIHRHLEAKVFSQADVLVTITPFYVWQFKTLAQRKVTLLTNGYDEDDFKDVVIRSTDKFLIRHVGIVNEKCNPRPFMQAIRELIQENKDVESKLRIEFIGEVHPLFMNEMAVDPVLKDKVIFLGNVPHKELLGMYGESSLLLLILTGYKDAEGFLPGKLFEYMATGLPILGVGPVGGDAAHVLSETGAGVMIDSGRQSAIKEFVKTMLEQWLTGKSSIRPGLNTRRYSRKEVTRNLLEIFR